MCSVKLGNPNFSQDNSLHSPSNESILWPKAVDLLLIPLTSNGPEREIFREKSTTVCWWIKMCNIGRGVIKSKESTSRESHLSPDGHRFFWAVETQQRRRNLTWVNFICENVLFVLCFFCWISLTTMKLVEQNKWYSRFPPENCLFEVEN